MTLPIPAGFPDWSREIPGVNVLEINDQNVTNPNGFVYPVRYIGNASWLGLLANAPQAGLLVTLLFWADPGATILLDKFNINLLVNDTAKMPIPVLGPFMTVFIGHSDFAAHQYSLQIWHAPTDGRFHGVLGELALFSQAGVAIGASATINVDCPIVMESPAVWTAFSASTSWQVTMEAVDYQGNVTGLDLVLGQSGSSFNHTLYLPPTHIRAEVKNFGAASTFTLFATRRHNR